MTVSATPHSALRTPHSGRVGIWLIGSRGGIATVLSVGLQALRKGWVKPVGLLTESPDWKRKDWASFEQLVVGGHEIRPVSLWDSAQELKVKSRLFSDDLLRKLKKDLARIDGRIRPGFKTPGRRVFGTIRKDLEEFRRRERLSTVIVVNVSSTEPAHDRSNGWTGGALAQKIAEGAPDVPMSVVYAYAALEAGCHYINFTPSVGSSWPALHELALARGVLHMGRDGKTGETLVKTALASMFRARHLAVQSWAGFNILGDRDGEALQQPGRKASKISTKSAVLPSVLGYQPHTVVGIDYVPSLHEWKTAWDFIHFQGFLETPMAMQFIWQGCDAVLAAPLVLDMVRLTAAAAERGERGAMPWLACFFKDPQGVKEHDFHKQVEMLKAHVSLWDSQTSQGSQLGKLGKPGSKIGG